MLQLSKGMRQKNSYLLQGFDCLVEKNVLVKNNKNTTQDKSSVTDDCYVNNCVGYIQEIKNVPDLENERGFTERNKESVRQ